MAYRGVWMIYEEVPGLKRASFLKAVKGRALQRDQNQPQIFPEPPHIPLFSCFHINLIIYITFIYIYGYICHYKIKYCYLKEY